MGNSCTREANHLTTLYTNLCVSTPNLKLSAINSNHTHSLIIYVIIQYIRSNATQKSPWLNFLRFLSFFLAFPLWWLPCPVRKPATIRMAGLAAVWAKTDCRIERLTAQEPSQKIDSEAGYS